MGIYKFLLGETFTHNSRIKPRYWRHNKNVVSFGDWLYISRDGAITVNAGYAWDGCSPKFKIFDLWLLGTPDGILNVNTGQPKTYFASLIHDALCQFSQSPQMPYSQAEIDRIFLERLQQDRFQPARLYYAAVKVFGGIYRWFTQD